MNKKTRTIAHAVIIAAAGTTLIGCSGSRDFGDSKLRAEPALSIPHQGNHLVIDESVRNLISVFMVDRNGKIKRASSGVIDTGCVAVGDTVGDTIPFDYIVIDVSSVIADPTLGGSKGEKLQAKRDKIAEIILFAADHNHNLFMNRLFTYQVTSKITRGFFDSVLNGGEVIAGLSSGPVAAALAGVQLGTNAFSSEIDETLFFQKSLGAIRKIIDAERIVMRDSIETRLTKPITEYSVHQMLRDIDRYTETSTFNFIASSLDTTAQSSEDAARQLVVKIHKNSVKNQKSGDDSQNEESVDGSIPNSLPAPTLSELRKLLKSD